MLVAARGRDLVVRMPRDGVVSETDGPYADLRGRPLMPWHVETVPKDCGWLCGIHEDEAVRQFDSDATQCGERSIRFSARTRTTATSKD